MRILLFLATNLAILMVSGVGLNIFMQATGVQYDLVGLLVLCAVFGMGGSLFSLFISKWMAKRSMGVMLIEQPRSADERWLVETVQQLADQAGIKMPEVGIFPSHQSNAFATGWNKDDALVAVSQGLLSRFSKDEIRAVMAHEIGHVANGDMVTLSLIQGVVNTFVFFFARIIGTFVDRAVFKNEHGHGIGFWIATMFAELVLGFLASMIVAWFSRWREFRADHMGGQLASNGAMIAALQRLKAEQGQPTDMPEEMLAFGIRSGLHSGLAALFATHPPLDDRIDALRHGI